MAEIDREFFKTDPVTCARELVGSIFRWHGCEARVVETEAYEAVGDEACHTWNRPGARRFVESHEAGTAYVYLNYGVHWLFNILIKGEEKSGFVLLRALEPVSGVGLMQARRGMLSPGQLCSGPGKLTKALGIDGSVHGSEFLGGVHAGLRLGDPRTLVCGPRIGISKATDRLWRFGDFHSASLSRKFPENGASFVCSKHKSKRG